MIKLVQGFDIRQPLPIDGRILLSEEEMRNVDTNIMPDKYFTINKDDGRLYLFDKNNSTATTTGGFRPADDAVKAYADEKAAEVDSRFDDYVSDEDLVEELAPYAKLVEAANKIDFRMDPGFILKLVLKNNDGEALDEAEIDLPLEQLIVDAEYDEERNVIILYVQSETGEVKNIEIPLGNLVSSLVSKVEFEDHAENVDMHVSDEERLKWNDAAEKANEAIKPDDMHTHINAGENVSIDVDDNGDITINAEDTVYEAGNGIYITDGVINASAGSPRWVDIVEDSMQGPMSNPALANLLNAKQNVIDEDAKIDADLVDDTDSDHKFVTAEQSAAIVSNTEAIAEVKVQVEDLDDALTATDTTATEALGKANMALEGVSSLDTNLSNLSSRVTTNETNISSINGQLSSLSSSLSSVSGVANAADTRSTTNEGNITSLRSDLTSAQEDIAALEEDVEGINGSITSINNSIDSINDAVDGLDASIDGLSDVATSGSYNDLIDKPTIPVVPTDVSAFNNDVGYITASQVDLTSVVPKTTEVNGHALSSNINLTAADVGALPSDTQYVAEESDPTVPSWAKQANKPTYTAAEVGALPSNTSIPNESTVSGWGFTKNAGTITGISMNGSSKGTSGVVNLGTVVTAESDPTVPAWAKAASKPTYTAAEVGAIPSTTNVVTSITVNGSSKTPTSGVVNLGTVVNAGDGIAVTTNNTVGISFVRIKLTDTGWTAIASPTAGAFGYSQTVNSSVIKGGHPVIDFDTSTYDATKYPEYLADYNKIYRAVTTNGSITFYAVAALSHSIYVNVLGG